VPTASGERQLDKADDAGWPTVAARLRSRLVISCDAELVRRGLAAGALDLRGVETRAGEQVLIEVDVDGQPTLIEATVREQRGSTARVELQPSGALRLSG